MLDPDALNDFGHYLSYDDRLKLACDRKGLPCTVYGSVHCEEQVSAQRPFFQRVFSDNSWSCGRANTVAEPSVNVFATELRRGLEHRRNEGGKERARLYMYCGSLPHAAVADVVLQDFPEVTACINLFWMTFDCYHEQAYVAQWNPVLDRVLRSPRVAVTSPTQTFADNLGCVFGFWLPVAPHPSVAFGDAAADQFLARSNQTRHRPFGPAIVMFPGGMRIPKGIGDTVGAVRKLATLKEEGIRCVVRALRPAKQEPGTERINEELQEIQGCTVRTESMSDDEFAAFLASADIIVLPYLTAEFKERTSGLLIDAMILGKPVVVYDETWLADVVNEYGCGIVVPHGDVDALCQAVLTIKQNLGRFADRARQAGLAYQKQNSWERLLDSVVAAQVAKLADATLVILGNGPSLKGFHFERLKIFDCIGMNAAYRYWRDIGWYPRYYACLDVVVGLSHKEAIADLIRSSDTNGIELFFLRRYLIDDLPQDLRGSPKVIDFDALHRRQLNSIAAKTLTTGSHSALIGAYLGYRRLVLLGIDCNYVEKVEGAKPGGGVKLEIAETPKDNPNYFISNYQVTGDKYNLPNPIPDLHLRSWRAVVPFLKSRDVTVWNCSPMSRVDAFHFRHFDDSESEQRARARPRTLEVDPRLFFPICKEEMEGPLTPPVPAVAPIPAAEPSPVEGPPTQSAPEPMPTPVKAAESPPVGRLYLRIAESVKARSNLGFRLGQFVIWCLRTLWHRRLGLGGLAVLAILVPLAGGIAAPSTYRWGLLGVSALCALMLLGALGLSFVRIKLKELMESHARAYAQQEAARALSRVETVEREAEAVAREQASIAFSKVCLNLKPLKEAIAQLEEVLSDPEALSSRTGLKPLTKAMAQLEKVISDPLGLSSRTFSADIVSALRALGPLWLGGNATEAHTKVPQVEHGHALLMAALVDESVRRRHELRGRTLIEIGTTRERDPAQGSTEKLALLTSVLGMKFITVDMDAVNTRQAVPLLRILNPEGQAITQRGEDYLAGFPGPLEFVYLDAFDVEHGKHSRERRNRYRKVLKTEITDKDCWEMHRRCAEVLVAKMLRGGIVVLDDTWISAEGEYEGKGKLAVPLLLENGFEVSARTRNAILLRRVRYPAESEVSPNLMGDTTNEHDPEA